MADIKMEMNIEFDKESIKKLEQIVDKIKEIQEMMENLTYTRTICVSTNNFTPKDIDDFIKFARNKIDTVGRLK